MIIGEIRRHLRDNNAVRVSRSLRDLAYKAMQAKEAIINRTSQEPTVEEIAAEMGVKKEDVVLALEAIVEPLSLYEPVYSDGGDTIFVMDQVGDKNGKSVFPRPRYPVWKKVPWTGLNSISEYCFKENRQAYWDFHFFSPQPNLLT